jgi:hypothetical protein
MYVTFLPERRKRAIQRNKKEKRKKRKTTIVSHLTSHRLGGDHVATEWLGAYGYYQPLQGHL